jgi:hypothetical protein
MVAADDIGGGVAFGMSDVQSVAAGIGEHIQGIQFASLGEPGSRKSAVFFPKLLPLGFNDGRIVAGHGDTKVNVSKDTGQLQFTRKNQFYRIAALTANGSCGPVGRMTTSLIFTGTWLILKELRQFHLVWFLHVATCHPFGEIRCFSQHKCRFHGESVEVTDSNSKLHVHL